MPLLSPEEEAFNLHILEKQGFSVSIPFLKKLLFDQFYWGHIGEQGCFDLVTQSRVTCGLAGFYLDRQRNTGILFVNGANRETEWGTAHFVDKPVTFFVVYFHFCLWPICKQILDRLNNAITSSLIPERKSWTIATKINWRTEEESGHVWAGVSIKGTELKIVFGSSHTLKKMSLEDKKTINSNFILQMELWTYDSSENQAFRLSVSQFTH